jgi:hypothetical protein
MVPNFIRLISAELVVASLRTRAEVVLTIIFCGSGFGVAAGLGAFAVLFAFATGLGVAALAALLAPEDAVGFLAGVGVGKAAVEPAEALITVGAKKTDMTPHNKSINAKYFGSRSREKSFVGSGIFFLF